MNSLGRLWRGEIALPDAFWSWAVLGGLVINAASSALFLFLVMADQPILALVAGYAPSVPYNIACGRCRLAGQPRGGSDRLP